MGPHILVPEPAEMVPALLLCHIRHMRSTILHEHIIISKCFGHSSQNIILQHFHANYRIDLQSLFNEHQRFSTIRCCPNHHTGRFHSLKHLQEQAAFDLVAKTLSFWVFAIPSIVNIFCPTRGRHCHLCFESPLPFSCTCPIALL
uniref:Uncharacterized protein n=1 Tax=Octopus bimaculoides TaxID=37653 RepID=A0A0L8GJH6_OCTBM